MKEGWGEREREEREIVREWFIRQGFSKVWAHCLFSVSTYCGTDLSEFGFCQNPFVGYGPTQPRRPTLHPMADLNRPTLHPMAEVEDAAHLFMGGGPEAFSDSDLDSDPDMAEVNVPWPLWR
jgi:hypothetical protein